MALRNGWFITTADDGERLIYNLVNGAPYQVEPNPEAIGTPAALIEALEPGYYDLDLNPVDPDVATAPDEPAAADDLSLSDNDVLETGGGKQNPVTQR